MEEVTTVSPDEPLILVLTLGIFCGAFVGAMANVTPFPLVMASAMLLSVVVWQQRRPALFPLMLMMGLFFGGLFGLWGGLIPYGFALFMGIQIAMTFWKMGGRSSSGSAPSMLAIPLYVIFSVGIFYNNTYQDFCQVFNASGASLIDVCNEPANWVKGFPTVYAGCVNDCTISAFSLLGSSVFSIFINSAAKGDYIGLLSALFTGSQSSIGNIFQILTTILTLTVGVILLLVGLGIGFSASILASGLGVTVNEAGTRFAQSFGITLIIWSVVFGAFGGLFSAFGDAASLTWGGVFATSMIVLFATMVFYGGYQQGKTGVG
jgi:hypothetical protein